MTMNSNNGNKERRKITRQWIGITETKESKRNIREKTRQRLITENVARNEGSGADD